MSGGTTERDRRYAMQHSNDNAAEHTIEAIGCSEPGTCNAQNMPVTKIAPTVALSCLANRSSQKRRNQTSSAIGAKTIATTMNSSEPMKVEIGSSVAAGVESVSTAI